MSNDEIAALVDFLQAAGSVSDETIGSSLERAGLERADVLAEFVADALVPKAGRTTRSPIPDLLRLHLSDPGMVASHGLDALTRISASARGAGDLIPGTEDYVNIRISELACEAAKLVLREHMPLMPFLGNQRFHLSDDGVVRGAGLELRIDRVQPAIAAEPFGLWKLRSCLESDADRENFDRWVLGSWHLFSERAFADLRGLVERKGIAPRKFLEAFPDGRRDRRWLQFVLGELADRFTLADGFERTAPASDWLDALNLMECFDANGIGRLADLGAWVRRESTAYLGALSKAAASVWVSDRAAGTYACLALLLHARSGTRMHKDLASRRLEQEATEFVRSLDETGAIIDLFGQIEILAFDEPANDGGWTQLGERGKRAWCRWILEIVLRDSDHRRAFIEFVLTRLGADAYRDVDPIVLAVLGNGGASIADPRDRALLERLVDSGSPPGKHRAKSILMDFEYGIVPKPSEELAHLLETASGPPGRESASSMAS